MEKLANFFYQAYASTQVVDQAIITANLLVDGKITTNYSSKERKGKVCVIQKDNFIYSRVDVEEQDFLTAIEFLFCAPINDFGARHVILEHLKKGLGITDQSVASFIKRIPEQASSSKKEIVDLSIIWKTLHPELYFGITTNIKNDYSAFYMFFIQGELSCFLSEAVKPENQKQLRVGEVGEFYQTLVCEI